MRVDEAGCDNGAPHVKAFGLCRIEIRPHRNHDTAVDQNIRIREFGAVHRQDVVSPFEKDRPHPVAPRSSRAARWSSGVAAASALPPAWTGPPSQFVTMPPAA